MILESLIGGGLTGILGSVITNVSDCFKRYQDRKHQLEMKQLDIQIMDKEWQYRERAAEREGEVRMVESGDDLRAASYGNDVATYSNTFKIKATWLQVLLVLVDFIRGLVRPALTLFLVWQVYQLQQEIQAVLNVYGGYYKMGADKAFGILEEIVAMVLYLTAVVVTWWFGSRAPGKKERKEAV